MFSDPEVKVQMAQYQRLARRFGRTPTDAEIRQDNSDQLAAAVEGARIHKIEEAKRAEEIERKLAERRNELDKRLQTRNTAPADFLLVDSVERLASLSKTGQANCSGARIEGTKDKPAVITLDLELFNFRRSTFRYVKFADSANLSGASFEGSIFDEVDFEKGSNFEGSDFGSAELNAVRFRDGCRLEGASFQFAKFKKGIVVEFDRNYLANATFAVARTDRWHRLARAYFGVFQYINLTLSGAYFAFLLLKLYLFRAISLMQDSVKHVVPSIGSQRNQFGEISVYDFVFGSSLASLSVALAILLYQAMRLYLTMRIGPLIEAERQTGYSPERTAFEHYLPLHSIVRVLGGLAFLLFVWELWGLWNQQPLLIPKFPKEIN